MSGSRATRKRGLTRAAIVSRALEIGNEEGLDAVSLRRLASDFSVTPMALYRHVKDKQDLINAMTEIVLDGLDLMSGVRPSMPWTDQARRALTNFRAEMAARPLALPLSIAYAGEGPPGFWRMSDDLLGILLHAGFPRRDAIVLIRVLSNLISGYLLLLSQEDPAAQQAMGPREMELMRKRMELLQLSLPADAFPNIVSSAHEMPEVWLSNPDRWWRETVDLIVFGLEALLKRRRARGRRTR